MAAVPGQQQSQHTNEEPASPFVRREHKGTPLCASTFPEGDKKGTSQEKAAWQPCLLQRKVALAPGHCTLPPFSTLIKHRGSSQELTDNSLLLSPSPSILHLLTHERGEFSAIKTNFNSQRSTIVSLMKLDLCTFVTMLNHGFIQYLGSQNNLMLPEDLTLNNSINTR